MLKLVSVNMEGTRHIPRILDLITTQSPEVICLQECPEAFQSDLQTLGYTTDFFLMQYALQNSLTHSEGLAFASKLPFTTTHKYYYQPDRSLPQQPVPTPKSQMHHGYILGTIEHEGHQYHLANTHVMWVPDGLPNEHQTQGIKKLLSQVATEKPHLLCGDFNIPRSINSLYEELTKVYTDNIPLEYKSSLDKNLHRLGNSTNLNAPIFDDYMVDYLFSKPEYEVSNVKLQFGVSDHAAVVAHISKNL